MTTNNTTNKELLLFFDYKKDIILAINYYKSQPEYTNKEHHALEEIAILEADTSFDYVKEEINKWIEQQGKGYGHLFGLDATINLWNGPVDFFKIYKIYDIDQLLSHFRDTINIKVSIYEDKVEIINTHHDGDNIYVLYPFNTIDKDTITHTMTEKLLDEDIKMIRKKYNPSLSRISYKNLAYLFRNLPLTELL